MQSEQMKMRALVATLALLLLPLVSHAQPSRPPSNLPRSQWKESWPTFSWVEGAATVSAGAATLVLALNPPPADPRWTGGILFDDAVRRALRADSAASRRRLRTIGDWPYYTAGVLPLLIDPLLVSLAINGDPKAAVNLELVSLEAFSYAGLLSFVSTRASVRERPDSTECLRQHPDGVGCQRDTESFLSGHTSIVAASAGLVCANHQYMSLWHNPVADASACVLASTASLVTGVSRIAADRHYTTDVIAGMAVGFGFGYGVPVLLHYTRRRPGWTVSIQPDVLGTGASLSVAGTL
jgi:membrane-associated phospholipid phosphatase